MAGWDVPEALAGVLDALDAETESLADQAAESIFSELTGYASVPADAIQKSMRSNVARAVATLRTGQPPASSTRAEAAAITTERARQGAPIDDIIRAYRLALRIIHSRFMTLAAAGDLDAGLVLQCSNLLWQVGDWFTASAAVSFRDLQVDLAVRQSVRRSELLRDLISGMIPETELWRAATTLEIDGAAEYAVFCIADPDAQPSLGRIGVGTTVEMSGRVYGLLAEGAALRPAPKAPVAIGTLRPIANLGVSTRVAAQLASLIAGNAPGEYRVDDMPWSVAAHAEPEVGTYLRGKYIEPLERAGAFEASLVESVAEYLRCDQNVSLAARELVVHPNTLRYRLARFEELTGVQLSTTRTVVELTMALDLRLPSPR